jgi:ABC-type nitrate/sulfonate/bicarbonate transport system permease component
MSGGVDYTMFSENVSPGDLAIRVLSVLVRYVKPLLGLLVVWWLVAAFSLIPEQTLPHPTAVWQAFVSLLGSGTLFHATWQTMFRALVAFVVAIILGITLGLGMAWSRSLEWFLDPIVSVGFPIPKVTLVPIYVLWFGFGTLPAIMLGVTSATFPVIIATYNGANGVKRELIWSARSMGVSRLRTTWSVVLPSALPNIFNGIQISLFLSFVVVVVAEMVTSGGGLGAILTQSIRFFKTSTVIAVIIVIATLGLLFDGVFRVIRAYFLRWAE